MNPAATAALSGGSSSPALVAWVAATLREIATPFGTLADVGCGRGDLAAALAGAYDRYLGLDLVRYPDWLGDPNAEFLPADLNLPLPLADACADAVAALETIEHLENPRAFVRELARIARPGAPVVLTTPNQLSCLSKLSLLVKNEFTAFQEAPGLYPTHITALLAADLLHIAAECGLVRAEIRYSGLGRIPGSARSWPAWVRRRWPRGASDNVMLLARKPIGPPA